MHILFVTPNLPVPTSSARVRPHNLIKQLAVRHKVSLLSFMQSSERAMLEQLRPFCQGLRLVPLDDFRELGKWQNRVRGWSLLLFGSRPRALYTFPVHVMRQPLRDVLQSWGPDVIHFEQLYLAELGIDVAPMPAVLGEQNVEFQVLRNLGQVSSDPIRKIRDELSWRKMRAFETRMVQSFPVCLAVSETDARHLRQLSGSTEVHVVENGVDSQAFDPAQSSLERRPDNVLFFGTLNYGPNRDGIQWFCREVWPQVQKARSEATLEIVGIDPPRDVMALADIPGVRVTGFVPDIRPKLWTATLTAAPLRWGGGTRLKILEALAAGCPVVSTTAGAEGLQLEDGKEIAIADTADAFAQEVTDLLEHPGRRRELASAGQRKVSQQYDWRSIAGELEKAYARAIDLVAPGAFVS